MSEDKLYEKRNRRLVEVKLQRIHYYTEYTDYIQSIILEEEIKRLTIREEL